MSRTTILFLCAFVALMIYKFQAGRRSHEEVSVMRQAVADGALLLDVRSQSEFNGGHLDGALNIPVGALESRIKELGSVDRSVVVYCASGVRSRTASKLLQKNGFHDVHDLGSLRNW
jgi:phage shock protein E